MATVKKLRATTFTTPSDREIVATRVIDAARRLVWEAWTSPKHVPHWLLGPEGWTMPVCEIDLRVGGSWQAPRFLYGANAPRRDPEGRLKASRSRTYLPLVRDVAAPVARAAAIPDGRCSAPGTPYKVMRRWPPAL